MTLQAKKLKMSLLIKQQTTSVKYRKGLAYYQAHKVTNIEQRGPFFKAKIKGSQSYDLWIDLDRYYGECNCPSDTRTEKCKHIVALALALVDKNYQQSSLATVKKETSPSKAPQALKMATDKKSSAKKANRLSSPYPKALNDFIETASQEDQLVIFYQLLKSDTTLQKTCISLIESRHLAQTLDRKKITTFFKKHYKIFETDFEGQKTQRSLDAIKSYIEQLERGLTDDKYGDEKRLSLANLIAEFYFKEFNYTALYAIVESLIDPVIDRFERNVKDYLALIENALQEDESHALWERLISVGKQEARNLIYHYICQSNVRKPIYFETSLQCQQYTMRCLLESLEEEDPYFHEILDECSYLEDKNYYYRAYYQKLGNGIEYLNYVNSLHATKVDQQEIDYLVELQSWGRLEAILDRFMADNDYANRSSHDLSRLNAFKLKADLIRELRPKAIEELTQLYVMVKNDLLIKVEEKAEFFWQEKQYLEIVEYFRWARSQSCASRHNNRYNIFTFSDHKQSLLFYLKHFTQIDNPIIHDVFNNILEIEKHYLKQTQSNNYDFTYELFHIAYEYGFREELIEFLEFCATDLPNRKKLNERLIELAIEKLLIQ